MLKAIDVLLGLTLVMLIASMAVTVLTQLVTSLINSRGKHLARGLADLLQQIDPDLERTIANQIACAVLTHPLISHLQGPRLFGARLGNTIHREEFASLLMEMASGKCFGLDKKQFPEDKLIVLLQKNGIVDPVPVLNRIRYVALELEQANPELSFNLRHSMAMMKVAKSQFLAKMNSWFDQTMDRVADRFTASTRVVTVFCSLIVVVAVQLDTIDVINRLAMDDELRAQLVVRAIEFDQANLMASAGQVSERQSSQQVELEQSPTLGQDQPASISAKALKAELSHLQDLGLINIVGSNKGRWWERWSEVDPIGVFLSVVLLSLGAPFWYSALKNLLKLRGVLASKDDKQRLERQETQPAKAPEPALVRPLTPRSNVRSKLTGKAP